MNKRFSTIKWLPANTFWFSEVDDGILEAFLDEYERRIGEHMVTAVKSVFQQLPAIEQAMTARPYTLIHGDLRADNLLFDGIKQNPEAVILNSQTACRSLGAMDLAFLIGGSEPEVERASHITEKLYLWHGEPEENGVTDYSIEDAKKDFQLRALRCLIVAIRLHSTLHEQSATVRGAWYRDESIERHLT